MADSPVFDLAVVGTGVAGLATALGGAQQGLRVALVGPRPRRFAVSGEQPFDARIYALSPGSVDLLTRLKVWPQVDAARMQRVTRMRVFGDTGAELDFDAWTTAVERLATIGEEGELLRVLDAACGFAPGIERIDDAFEALVRDGEAAELRLAGGATLRARLVVGADGANSAVRAACGINADVREYGQTAVVANFAAGGPHDETAWQWFTRDGIVALLPLPGDAASLVWSAPDPLAAELLALPPEGLAARVGAVADAGGASHLLPLAAAGRVHSFPLRRITVDRLIDGRVALVGDAAHVVHPLAGQGLNLGLQDVSMLLAELAAREAFREPGDPVLLRRYARRRAESIALMRGTTDALARMFEVETEGVRAVRNAGMKAVNAIGPLKRALIRHALG